MFGNDWVSSGQADSSCIHIMISIWNYCFPEESFHINPYYWDARTTTKCLNQISESCFTGDQDWQTMLRMQLISNHDRSISVTVPTCYWLHQRGAKDNSDAHTWKLWANVLNVSSLGPNNQQISRQTSIKTVRPEHELPPCVADENASSRLPVKLVFIRFFEISATRMSNEDPLIKIWWSRFSSESLDPIQQDSNRPFRRSNSWNSCHSRLHEYLAKFGHRWMKWMLQL